MNVAANISFVIASQLLEGSGPGPTESSDPTESRGHSESRGGSGIILFLGIAVGIGALVRHILKHTPLPYTVILMVVGLLIGLATKSSKLSFLQDYTVIAGINPDVMLLTFLPTLIFESAFVMDIHTFKKTIFQALLLACPGLIISTVLTAIMARYIFTYDWSWATALLFGTIFSATDPVAVVALLKDLGTSKQLGIVIEGESLLNDGVAIVGFYIFLDELIPDRSRSSLDIFVYLVRVALGGPLFGYFMARLTILWLSRVFNDAVVEITITLASTYFTYYVGDVLLGVSGVLAVVTLGLEVNARRTYISPEVEVFLLKFWGMLSYLANTLIFILVGVVIAQRAFSRVENRDWIYLVSLYFGITIIRLLMVAGLYPVLVRTGYPINWKSMLVITWSGLRGAVSLALALVVEQTTDIPNDTIGSKVLFHTAGIVVLTLLVNATTVRYLLDTLGLSDISNARRLTMVTAIRRITEAKGKAMRLLKSDRFLADAHWEVVDRKTVIENPFDSDQEDEEFQGVGVREIANHCPDCHAAVPRIPNTKEFAELAEDMRVRIIRAEKTSYRKQFEEGMLDRVAVLALNNLADTITDIPHKLIEMKDIEHYWRIPRFLLLLRYWTEKAISFKISNPSPLKGWFVEITHYIVVSSVFEWAIIAVVLVDIIFIIALLSVTNIVAATTFRYINCVAVGVYTSEAMLKFIGLRFHYFKSLFNINDFILLLLAWCDVLLEILSIAHVAFAIRVVTTLRIVRIARALKLFKVVLPLVLQYINYRIKFHVRLGYAIGKGFVVGEEEVLLQFDRIASVVHKNIAHRMRKRVDIARLDVIRSLGLMQQKYPGVALSVKTRQAIRAVLNHCRSTFEQLREGGVLEEHDSDILSQNIEVKMKQLQRSPVTLTPPDPNSILYNHPWLNGLDNSVLIALQKCANLISRHQGEVLLQYGEPPEGIFIIVSGLVKVVTYKQVENSSSSLYYNRSREVLSHEEKLEGIKRARSSSEGSYRLRQTLSPGGRSDYSVPSSPERILSSSDRYNLHSSPSSSLDKSSMLLNVVECIDFYDVGNVLGEIGILERKDNEIDAICETNVQVFLIQKQNLENLMQKYPVLKDRMWKILGIHIASTLLIKQDEYQDWPINKLLLMLYEAAHILPECSAPQCVEIQNDWKQVILISGEVETSDTHNKLVAPCIVPNKMKNFTVIGKPKVLVVSLSKSGAAKDIRRRKHYKVSVKTFLTKIKKLMWAQYVTAREYLAENILQFFEYVVNQCSRCWQHQNKVHVQPSPMLTATTDRDDIIQIDPPDGHPTGINRSAEILRLPTRLIEGADSMPYKQSDIRVTIDSVLQEASRRGSIGDHKGDGRRRSHHARQSSSSGQVDTKGGLQEMDRLSVHHHTMPSGHSSLLGTRASLPASTLLDTDSKEPTHSLELGKDGSGSKEGVDQTVISSSVEFSDKRSLKREEGRLEEVQQSFSEGVELSNINRAGTVEGRGCGQKMATIDDQLKVDMAASRSTLDVLEGAEDGDHDMEEKPGGEVLFHRTSDATSVSCAKSIEDMKVSRHDSSLLGDMMVETLQSEGSENLEDADGEDIFYGSDPLEDTYLESGSLMAGISREIERHNMLSGSPSSWKSELMTERTAGNGHLASGSPPVKSPLRGGIMYDTLSESMTSLLSEDSTDPSMSHTLQVGTIRERWDDAGSEASIDHVAEGELGRARLSVKHGNNGVKDETNEVKDGGDAREGGSNLFPSPTSTLGDKPDEKRNVVHLPKLQ